MRFGIFRRWGLSAPVADEAAALHVDISEPPEVTNSIGSAGFVNYALLLDAHKRVRGYRLAWRAASPHGASSASENFRALLSCVSTNLNGRKTGWRLGALLVFFDLTVDGLFLRELEGLPPENVVLCMGLDDLADADARSMMLHLRAQGFGFMLCDADDLPEDPEMRAIVTHMDAGDGRSDLVASIRQEPPPGMPRIEPIATQVANWRDFDACAARQVSAFVKGRDAITPAQEAGGSLTPTSMLIVHLMQLIQRNEDVRVIEAALKHDAALTYRLLRFINSPGMGIGVQIQSIGHAISMIGYAPLFRWLSVLLVTSNKGAAFMAKKAIVRGRFVELMGRGTLPPDEADNLFVAGMFSLIDRLLGVPIEEVLDNVQLPESVQLAILKREGTYGPFVTLAERCEDDADEAAQLAEALFISADKVNAAHLSALAWAQEVSPAEAIA
ncbi:EAL and HDOD domain-containing protein [Variovorax ginsengisoli]|uniref:HDOD domain-containing protein n=1 Tax=Variovorax ginsengisoli TaxID=363844 RepID=A0ABT8SGB2_9BURK|nr:HDOD domain-containing protein [Variovorax ginsengisoli]MDN8618057.1 HDOD domain-containing protein [Variovorax ginsengisoli]MDO1537227.1 HDOD domain-containing protein [Variovorax ginsengisoli]